MIFKKKSYVHNEFLFFVTNREIDFRYDLNDKRIMFIDI